MKKTIIFLMLWLIYGCNEPTYLKENSAFIIFKTPTFKYADMGFIYQSPQQTKLQIYANAQAIMSLKLTQDSICMSALECMTKKRFNKQVLSSQYPDNILQDILNAKPIFAKKDIKYTQQGFAQELKKQNSYNIKYKVSKNKIEFIDTINHITIKIIKDI